MHGPGAQVRMHAKKSEISLTQTDLFLVKLTFPKLHTGPQLMYDVHDGRRSMSSGTREAAHNADTRSVQTLHFQLAYSRSLCSSAKLQQGEGAH